MKRITFLISLFILSTRFGFSHEFVAWNDHWCNGSIQIIEKEQLDIPKEWSLEEQVSFLENDIIFDDYGVRLRELDD